MIVVRRIQTIKLYKPIGDVVILDNNEYIKTEETEMYPKYLKK